MNRKIMLIFIGLLIFLPTSAYSQTYWGGELPNISNTQLKADVTLVGDIYTYSYTIISGHTNSGQIWSFDIDIKQIPGGAEISGEGLTNGLGYLKHTSAQILSEPDTPKMIPVGLWSPSNWNSGPDILGRVGWGSDDMQYRISPGQSLSGFQITSRGLPSLRNFIIQPKLIPPPAHETDRTPEESRAIIKEVKDKVAFKGKTLGPTAPPLYFDPKKFLNNTIRGYVNESVTLGWLIDPTLTNTILAKLDLARSFLDADEPTQAKAALNDFMTIIKDASATQRTTEAYGLLYFNAQYLITQLPDTTLPPPPAIPRLELTPKDATLPVGDIHTLTPTFQVEQGDSVYFPQVPVKVKVTSGPNTGLVLEAVPSGTDPMSVTYTSMKEGIDILEAQVDEVPEVPDVSAGIPGATSMPVKVTWTGGSDLFILLFIPPLLKAKGGDAITVTEITGNKGSTGAEPSITRYFLSTDPAIEPDKDVFIGERFIPPLAPEEISDGGSQEFWLPDDLPQGTYHLGACADGDQSVIELNEANNCLVNQVVIALEQSTNQPPSCAQAVGRPNKLWPPNHKLVPITVQGITDPDGDPLILSITKITQDEPVNGLGDGDTSPDGFGVGTSQAQIRSERSGKGSGRMYAITFTAIDGKDGECTGIVHVGVPHDQGKGANPIDDGQNYDSTVP